MAVVVLTGVDSNKYVSAIRFKHSLPPNAEPQQSAGRIQDTGHIVNGFGESEATLIREKQKLLSEADSDQIVAEYTDGKTLRQIAAEVGCHHVTVRAALERRGVPIVRSKSKAKLDMADVLTMYAEQHTSQEIADKYGVGPQVVIQSLRAQGVAIRGRWEYR